MTDPRIPVLAAEWLRLKEGLLAFEPDLVWDTFGDDPIITDTLDGIADAGDYIAMWCRKAREDEAMAVGLRSMIADMQMRLQRLSSRADKWRDTALCLMNAIGEKKIIRPDLTITVQAGRPAVRITDDAALPDDFLRVVKTPDKAAIKEAIERGEPVPGAVLSNREETLTIRSK